MQDAGCKIQDERYRMQDGRCRMQDARYRLNDTRCGMDRMIRMVGWLIPESVPCALHLEPYAFVR